MSNTKTISEFKTKLAGGEKHPNLFEVKMPNFPARDSWSI